MDDLPPKPPRGRPKTFDRDHVISVAMGAYWAQGQGAVSLNEICRRAQVSKPTLYKEFGSEDGLKQAVLLAYHQMTLAPLYEMLAQDQPFETARAALAEYILRDHAEHGMPNGCLFVDLCQSRTDLGAMTGAQVDAFQALSLQVFETWIRSAQEQGELSRRIPPPLAALYIDSQIANLMTLQRQGMPQDKIRDLFTLALTVFDEGL